HMSVLCSAVCFFFTHPSTTDISTLSLHDALPIWSCDIAGALRRVERKHRAPRRGDALAADRRADLALRPERPRAVGAARASPRRSEEHTSELQSRFDLVCRLLLEKKKPKKCTDHT